MNGPEVAVFVDGIVQYFEVATEEKPSIGSPYITEAVSWSSPDYAGIIDITGRRSGRVCFAAPEAMLQMILADIGEADASESQLRDLVGEVANVLSGYARKHFGRHFRISVPSVTRDTPNIDTRRRCAVVIPLRWREQEANVVVSLDRAA